MNEEIKEILSKLSNRKQETLLQGLRECQLKNIEHPFITKEEYVDKTLNYINTLQQENQSLKEDIKNLVRIISKNCDDLEATEKEFESLYRWENE